jgi:hypothetical protein
LNCRFQSCQYIKISGFDCCSWFMTDTAHRKLRQAMKKPKPEAKTLSIGLLTVAYLIVTDVTLFASLSDYGLREQVVY